MRLSSGVFLFCAPGNKKNAFYLPKHVSILYFLYNLGICDYLLSDLNSLLHDELKCEIAE